MPSSVAKHTIPSFYACYFLRSLASPGTTYIGSTPAPPRRKRQHNGDLTQGAYKTVRARPWEMECIVYGFSSKIAALQFEWAWAKPHLSRHLKFSNAEYSALGAQSDTSAWVGMPLFPSTSMTPGQNRWGKPKRRIARPPSTPNARLLAMRALLRSEPFCGWGLKLAFFTEWSWLAYQRLEATNHAAAGAPTTSALQLQRYSRSGKPLHPLYPLAVCDFSGVDGKRIPLVHVSQQHRLDAGIADQLVKKRQSSSKNKHNADEIPQWTETLPRIANLKGLDACIRDFDAFPSPQPAPRNTDLTRKVKRKTNVSKDAATGQAALEEEDPAENGADEDDTDMDPATSTTTAVEAGSTSTRVLHTMRFEDSDLEESEWRRFERLISAKLSPPTMLDHVQAMSDFMQTCVQRYIAAQDARTINDAAPAPTAPCSFCRQSVDLTRHLDFVLCPSPHTSTLPFDSTASSQITGKEIDPVETNHCNSVYHLSCLAHSFLQQHRKAESSSSSSTRNTILPTHGVCPNPSHLDGDHKEVAMWADVVRAMYRRSERFDRLLQHLVKSGRTLAEHLNPPESEVAAKTVRPRGRPKGVRAEDVTEVDTESAETGKKAKSTAGRKRKQPATSVSDGSSLAVPGETQTSDVNDGEGKTEIKRKARKAKGPVSNDVIDLT